MCGAVWPPGCGTALTLRTLEVIDPSFAGGHTHAWEGFSEEGAGEEPGRAVATLRAHGCGAQRALGRVNGLLTV